MTSYSFPAEEISILYANRSAALYHLQNFKAALNDIARSIAHNYPDHLLHKVRERQARCYLALKLSADALQSFKATIQALDHSKMPYEKRAKIEKDAQVMIKLLQREEELLAKQKRPNPEVKPEVDEKPTQTFVSPAMAYESTKEEGRFAVAKKQINVAEPIIVEKPYCSVLLELFCKSNCENCFKRVHVPVPCSGCSSVMYCSNECQANAQATYHKYECGRLPVIWASGISVTCHMALRMISQRTIDYFVALKDDLNMKIEPKDWDSYANSDYRKVYGLGTHAESRNSEDLFQRSVMAKFLLELLVEANYFDGQLDSKK
jgi:SET and MYND domain-containing protein 4